MLPVASGGILAKRGSPAEGVAENVIGDAVAANGAHEVLAGAVDAGREIFKLLPESFVLFGRVGIAAFDQHAAFVDEFGEDFDGGADIVWHGGRVDGRERFVDGLGGVGVVAFFAGCGDEGGDAADRGAFARFGLKRDGPKSVGEGVVGGFFPEGDEVGDAEVVQHRLGERGFAGEVENLRKVELDVSLLFEQIQRPSARGRFLAASAERPAWGALDLQQPEGFAKLLFRFVRLSQHGEDAGERVEVRRHRHPFDGALRGLERFGVAPHPV